MQRRQVQEAEMAGEGLGKARGKRARERDGGGIVKLMMDIGDGGSPADADSAWDNGQKVGRREDGGGGEAEARGGRRC